MQVNFGLSRANQRQDRKLEQIAAQFKSKICGSFKMHWNALVIRDNPTQPEANHKSRAWLRLPCICFALRLARFTVCVCCDWPKQFLKLDRSLKTSSSVLLRCERYRDLATSSANSGKGWRLTARFPAVWRRFVAVTVSLNCRCRRPRSRLTLFGNSKKNHNTRSHVSKSSSTCNCWKLNIFKF